MRKYIYLVLFVFLFSCDTTQNQKTIILSKASPNYINWLSDPEINIVNAYDCNNLDSLLLIADGIVLTGGSSNAEGLVDLAEEVFHKQVRIGVPQHIYGGSKDIVKNPEYATSIGLLLYAKEKNNLDLEPLNEDFLHALKKLLRNIFYN